MIAYFNYYMLYYQKVSKKLRALYCLSSLLEPLYRSFFVKFSKLIASMLSFQRVYLLFSFIYWRRHIFIREQKLFHCGCTSLSRILHMTILYNWNLASKGLFVWSIQINFTHFNWFLKLYILQLLVAKTEL